MRLIKQVDVRFGLWVKPVDATHALNRCWPILLKNSKKVEGRFSAESQFILNFLQNPAC